MAYSARNRSASWNTCNYESQGSKNGNKISDAAGNPYLTFASMLMAGIDGIKNKIDPGKPFDQDLYSLGEDGKKITNSLWFS